MMTIGIPKPAPGPTQFYVPDTYATRDALSYYGLPDRIIVVACGGTWPIGVVSKGAVAAPEGTCVVGGWWFPLSAVQLL